MSVLQREHLVVLVVSETSDLTSNSISGAMRTASNVFNRDELIGLLTRAIWGVGHGEDLQIDSKSADELAEAARRAMEQGEETA